MEKKKLEGVANPGWTFSETRLLQLIELFKIINKLQDNKKYSYKEFQNISDDSSDILDNSKTRMLFPHLNDLDFIQYDKNNTFTRESLLTSRGKEFLGYVVPIYVYRDSMTEDIQKKIEEIFSQYICWGYKKFISKKFKEKKAIDQQKVYKELPEIINKMKYINNDKYEIFVIIEGIVNNMEHSQIEDMIVNQFRIIKHPESEYEIIHNQNAKGYIIPFLEQARIIKKVKVGEKKVIKIGENWLEYINNQEINND